MALSMYEASVPVFVRMLEALSAVLDKAEAFAAVKKIDGTVLAASRIAPDMFPMSRQVQIACDFAKGTAARLAGVDVPVYEDFERTIPELKGRNRQDDFIPRHPPAGAVRDFRGPGYRVEGRRAGHALQRQGVSHWLRAAQFLLSSDGCLRDLAP